MRTVSADQSAARSSGVASYGIRVSIEDWTGAMVELGAAALGGFQWLRSVRVREEADQPHMTAEVTVAARAFQWSLMPLDEASPINRGLNPSAAPQQMLEVFRKLYIDFAYGAGDQEPTSWTRMFEGRIDRIRAGSGEDIVLECRDMLGFVTDTVFERHLVYGLTPAAHGTQKGCLIFAPLNAIDPAESYAVGDLVLPSTLNGYLYRVTSITTGFPAATEPTWPTTIGNTVTSGGVTFRCDAATAPSGVAMEIVIQQMLNDSGVTGLGALVAPATGFSITPYKQDRVSVLDAIRNVALLIGGAIIYRWDSVSSSFRPTLWVPNRANTTPDVTIQPSEIIEVSALDLDIASIRNKPVVIFSDATDLGSDGKTRRRKRATSTNTSLMATSQARYGKRYMEIAEEETSQIDTLAEAQNLANIALSDLAMPTADHSATTSFLPWVQVGDLIRWKANGIHYTADQDLAAMAVEHSVETQDDGAQDFVTSIATRGKPSIGASRWLQVEARIETLPPHSMQIVGGVTLQAEPLIGGVRVNVLEVLNRHQHWDGAEIHVSTAPGFTPTTSTLAAQGKGATFEIQKLKPGATYYVKAIPRLLNADQPVVGEPSAEVPVTAGQGGAGHLVAGVDWGRKPLNGGFESRLDASGMPDHWTSSQYGTQVVVTEGSAALSGNRYLVMFCAAGAAQDAAMGSQIFDIIAGQSYILEFWRKCVQGTGGNFLAVVYWFNSAFAFISASGPTVTLTDSVGTWARTTAILAAPATAKYGMINFVLVRSGGTEDREVHVDNVSIALYSRVQEDWQTPSFGASWSNFNTASFNAAGYYKDDHGRVWLRGLVGGGNVGSTIFTLPAGYRPAKEEIFVVQQADRLGSIRVQTTGAVIAPQMNIREVDNTGSIISTIQAVGPISFISLDGLSFRV